MRLTEAEYQSLAQKPRVVQRGQQGPPRQRQKRPSKATNTLLRHCELSGVPLPVLEYRFCERRWRFDAAWPEPQMVALEIDGGAWTNGRHTRGAGFIADCEKLNEATLLGWRVIRVTPQQVENGKALALVQRALGGHT